MAYHPFTEQGHKCPKCKSRFMCTMEDGTCENAGTCDECIQDAEYDRLNRWNYNPDYDDAIPEDTPSLDGFGPHY